MAGRRHVTLGEVAKAAGVSIATASRAINGSTRRVNEDIRRRVRQTAEELGYLPNLSAQTVVKGASPTVAVLVSDIADPYFSSIASGIMQGARELGFMVTMAASERRTREGAELLRTFRGQRPQAIVVVGSRREGDPHAEEFERQLSAYSESGGHVVLVSQGPSPFDLVDIQNSEGARELAHALVSCGGRGFAVVAGDLGLYTNAERLAGFRRGLEECGVTLSEDAVAEGQFTRDGGYAAMQELLTRKEALGLELDTVFATSDLMAFGAATALRSAGIEPGKGVSLAGFDNIALTEDVTPSLTTVDVPLGELGYQAVRLALDKVDSGSSGDASEPPEPVRLPIRTTVVLRASTPQR